MLGKKCKLYHDTIANRATWGAQSSTTGRHEGTAPATLTEIESAQDVTLPGERDTAETGDRGRDYKSSDTGAWGGAVAVKLNHRTTDAGRDALFKAWVNNEPIAAAILNGDKATTGTRGLWADWKVSKFVENQPMTDHVTYDVELVLYDGPDGSEVAPEFIEVTAT